MPDSLFPVVPIVFEFLALLTITIIVALIKPIRYKLFKFFSFSFAKSCGFKVLSLEDAHSHNRVQETVIILRDNLHADRVAIFQFENGSRFSLSNPTWKITQTYQSVAEGRAYVVDYLKQEPVTSFIEMIIPMFDLSKDYQGFSKISIKSANKQRVAVCVNASELPNCRYRYELIKHGVKCDYLFPLKNSEGKMFGICSVNFSYRRDLTDENLIDANKSVEKIQTYLNNMFLDSIK